MWRALVSIVVLAPLLAGTASAQVPDRTDRVLGAARVWAKAKFFHPYLAYRDIDWDAAFVAALPKIEAATTVEQYKAAIGEMLARLGDPVTRIGDPAGTSTVAAGAQAWSWATPGTLFVDLAAFTAGGWDSRSFQARGDEIEKAAAQAKVIVVDLRTTEERWVAAGAVAYFIDALPAIEHWPVQRTLEHRGWRTQEGMTSGGYDSMFITTGAKPAGKPKPTGPQFAVFVADARSSLPVEAIALQASGRAMIVASGSLDPAGTVDTAEVELPGGFTATVRLGESLWGPPTADVIAKDPRARALELAKSAVAKPRVPKQAELPPLRVRDDADYADALYPSRELRVLAGVRVWAVFDRFFPYHYLLRDWDGVFREMYPRLEAAPDRDTYINVLREMGARTDDGHVGLAVAVPDPKLKPRGTVGMYLRLVDGKAVVVRTVDAAAEKALQIGDVVEAIDGVPVADLIAKKRAITSSSTAAPRDQRIVRDLAFGDDGTLAKLAVRDARGKLRDVELPRATANLKLLFEPAAGPHWKKLPNNIGYVNLMALKVPEVPKMFEELAGTRGIVFDLRGYPNGVVWALAPRLNVKRAKFGAQFLQPLVTGAGGDERIRFMQPIAELPKGAQLYKGKVVVMIDDRAISQSEHTCLFLSEAAGATFVGSTTHGANGDVTALRIPGGLRMYFTGQEVRWVDGRQLQRVGVVPSVKVLPTLRAIRAGKDEVLDRAVSVILSGKP